jgi:heme A synthase
MKKNRIVETILIFATLGCVALYVTKIDSIGISLAILALLSGAFFLVKEIQRKPKPSILWTIVLLILPVLLIGLGIQTLLTHANNLIAICVASFMYTALTERSRALFVTKKS